MLVFSTKRIRDRRTARQAQALRTAVAELPVPARQAMLDAVDSEELIIGAYTDLSGRICPMLAAHRRGARTDVGRFPRAWDTFGRARRPRPATRRELEILGALLQESLDGVSADQGRTDRARPVEVPRPGVTV